MQRLIDANVVCRVMTEDVEHPRYYDAERLLIAGGILRLYVLPEIAFQALMVQRMKCAERYAEEVDELALFRAAPRVYASKVTPPSGWRKQAYVWFNNRMAELLSDYADIEIEDRPLYEAAMQIAIQTGYDWVDCILLAEENLGRGTVSSLDKDIGKGRSGVSTMDLTKQH